MTTPTSALPRETDVVLLSAADYIDRHGWTPTGLYDPHSGCTRRCRCHYTGTYPASLAGALRAVIFGQPRWYLDLADPPPLHAYSSALEWLNTYLIAIGHAGRHAPVFDWQTTPGRTAADACGALRAAAHAYRHQHPRRTAA